MTWLDEIRPDLEQMIRNISQKNLFRGGRIPKSIMDQFEIEQKTASIGVLVPYWLSVLERGRGPWRGVNVGTPLLREIIYSWIIKRNMFSNLSDSGKRGMAFVIARKINREGNVQFRKHAYIDVYTTERAKTIEAIDKKFSLLVSKITTEVI